MATIAISCSTPESRIYYTLDGSIPTESSNLYSEPFELNTPSTLKSLSRRDGWLESDVAEEILYSINYEWIDTKPAAQIDISSKNDLPNDSLNLGIAGNTYYLLYNAGVPMRIDISVVNETTQEPIELTSPTFTEDGMNFYLSFVMPSSSIKITAKYHNSAN